jgi:hypothetical protein
MKRIAPIIFVLVLLISAGVVAADPGPNNPHLNTITNVDCEGDNHDYDLLYTVGLSPWFDANSTAVSPGPTSVEIEEDGQWVSLFELKGKGNPTLLCTWTRGDNNYRGDVQFAPNK